MCPRPRNNCSHGAESSEISSNGPGDLQDFTRQLLRRLSLWENPQQIEASLHMLMPLSSRAASASLIVGEIPSIVEAMRHEDSTESMKVYACQVLVGLVCPCCHNTTVVDANCAALVDGGAVEACVRDLALEGNSAEVLQANCKLLSQLVRTNHAFSSEQAEVMIQAVTPAMVRYPDMELLQGYGCFLLSELAHQGDDESLAVKERGGVQALLGAMQHHAADAGIQSTGIHALLHVSFCENGIVDIQEAGGTEAVAEGMGGHLSDPDVQVFGCRFFRSVACRRDDAIESSIRSSGAIQRVLDAMREYPASPELQTMACAALWNISTSPTNAHLICELGGIQALVDTMTTFESDAAVQEHAMGVLWNLALAEDLRIVLTDAGAIELIVKAMETHSDHAAIEKEGTGALFGLAGAEDRRVRLALTETGAIPALRSVFQKYNLPLQEMMQNMTLERSQMLEASGSALTRLGVMEVRMIGEEGYDPDDEEDEGPLESPPFDIGNLLLRTDLTNSAPGWYRDRPFCVDWGRSYLRKRETEEAFLLSPTAPAVGQHICLRILLPYGGRGHLYGSVTRVGPLPTDEELTRSDSSKYGRECRCNNPTCPVQNGTREELLFALGTLHGHEVTGVMSLHLGDRFETERKLRFGPLPEFFRGENSRYEMKLRFNDNVGRWQVVSITVASTDSDEESEED